MLRGPLRDFSAADILQMLGMQRKSGCLVLEHEDGSVPLYVHEGRIVAARRAGLSPADPLLRLLLRTQRLSVEQHQGIRTIQQASGRDLEDLLVNGRYLEADELAGFLERQILEDLTRVLRWEDGEYRFDPTDRWSQPIQVALTMEGALIEGARRLDESRRFEHLTRDPEQRLTVLDLPDTDAFGSEEERDLFGAIDGRRTLRELAAQAALTEYETYEALQRMLDGKWIAVVPSVAGAPAAPPRPVPVVPVRAPASRGLARTLVVTVALGLLWGALATGIGALRRAPVPAADDVFAAAQVRDLRHVLALYRREQGRYPQRLEELATHRWMDARELRPIERAWRYAPGPGGLDYRLEPITR